LRIYSRKPLIHGRKPTFVYFGGGTPSFLSTRQLSGLVEGMREQLPWDEAEEVAFECEPGTLTESKLRVIRDLGITRLSLGIENFDDEILTRNGRAHVSKEIYRSYNYARSIGFPQINIDLIAGMMGETEDNWRECVRKTVELSPDSITAYQMEIPHNTTIFANMKVTGDHVAPVATWGVKRRWIRYAFSEFEKAGYTISSAYTAVKDPAKTRFLYRDLLWQGADMIGLGVASISHAGGVHFQNNHEIGPYIDQVESGELPIYRALEPTHEERMIREFILQMKLGQIPQGYFRDKFGVDIRQRFSHQLQDLEEAGLLRVSGDSLRLSRDGLTQVDKILHRFFLPEHQISSQA
jgi:oxygen-independent coproporphyrinogen-3 oxidase